MKYNKNVISMIVLGISVPIGYYTYKRWKKRKLLDLIQSMQCDKSANSKVITIKANDDSTWTEIQKLALTYRLMAVDLEWVQKSVVPIALLQLSFPNGHCYLINHHQKIPNFVLDLFTNEQILKIGVGILDEDLKKFKEKWSIEPKGLVDLRHVALKFYPNLNKLGVQSLTQTFLKINLDKDWRIRASNWENDPLSDRQIAYAANDVLTVMSILLTITFNNFSVSNFDELLSQSYEICSQFVDRRFSKKFKSKSKSPAPQPNSQKKVPKNGHSVLSRPLYDNSRLEAPDGELLCVCDSKKALWYVSKNLGKVIENSPTLTVRLNFEPAGRPKGQAGDYYLAAKNNFCVVCGVDKCCLRKYIVPHEYRKLFPEVMRDHQSHDVLLMCLNCHQASNRLDHQMRSKLATMSGSPLDEIISKTKEDFDLKAIRSAGRALLKDFERNKIPMERKRELIRILKEHFEKDELGFEVIEAAANIDTCIQNEEYVSHAESVVTYFAENEGILKLEKLWRQHFLDSMKPQFLPPNWSIDHQEDRLSVRQEENRIEEKDLELAVGKN